MPDFCPNLPHSLAKPTPMLKTELSVKHFVEACIAGKKLTNMRFDTTKRQQALRLQRSGASPEADGSLRMSRHDENHGSHFSRPLVHGCR